jgi:hypothetical protein
VIATPLAVVAGETVPHGAVEQETVHLTPAFAGSLVTVAVKFPVLLGWTVAEFGDTDTVTAGIVTVADPDFDISSTEVAVMVTFMSLAGGLAGALYVTEVLVTLLRVPAPDAGERLQVTPLLAASLAMVVVNACVPAACTVAESGETDTATA